MPAPANDVRLLKKASFPKAKNWELDAIMTAEEGFGKIRRCAERLENIRLEVSGFTQLMNALKSDGRVITTASKVHGNVRSTVCDMGKSRWQQKRPLSLLDSKNVSEVTYSIYQGTSY